MVYKNLPLQLTSFIGREQEILDVTNLLSSSHLVTLTGPGGSGKTRLAIQIANAVSEPFVDGVWLIDLVPLHEPDLVPQLVALAFGLRPNSNQSFLELLQDFVKTKHILLILDNCEHLSDACAHLARGLLSREPELRILATSRQPLAIAGETIYPIAGLAWPSPDKHLVDHPQDFMQYDAVRLFVERARTTSPKFNISPENAWSMVEICRRLDGLPLALELASARINVLTLNEITARLNDRFNLLTSGQKMGFEPRHQTLRAAIDWSYSLLSPDEQVLLRRLAVFTAGITIDMAETICCGEGLADGQTIELLSSLVDKSLIIAETGGRTEARYRLLDTIREYGLEKLDEAGETAQLRHRHLDIFLIRAEEAAPKLGEAYQQLWLNWLESEHDNLRAALAWSLESNRIEDGLRIATALVRFWEIRGYILEGIGWFERLLDKADEKIHKDVRVNALVFASFMASFIGNAQASLAYGREAVKIAEEITDKDDPVISFALGGLATGARTAGDYQTAFTIQEQMISTLRGSGNSFYLGMSLLAQGGVAIELGCYDEARLFLDESLALARKDGDAFRSAHALNSLGDLARCEKNYVEAARAYGDSAMLLQEIGAQHDLASILTNSGHTHIHLGDVGRAYTIFKESMEINRIQQNRNGMVECLIGFAGVAIIGELPAAGVRLADCCFSFAGSPHVMVRS